MEVNLLCVCCIVFVILEVDSNTWDSSSANNYYNNSNSVTPDYSNYYTQSITGSEQNWNSDSYVVKSEKQENSWNNYNLPSVVNVGTNNLPLKTYSNSAVVPITTYSPGKSQFKTIVYRKAPSVVYKTFVPKRTVLKPVNVSPAIAYNKHTSTNYNAPLLRNRISNINQAPSYSFPNKSPLVRKISGIHYQPSGSFVYQSEVPHRYRHTFESPYYQPKYKPSLDPYYHNHNYKSPEEHTEFLSSNPGSLMSFLGPLMVLGVSIPALGLVYTYFSRRSFDSRSESDLDNYWKMLQQSIDTYQNQKKLS